MKKGWLLIVNALWGIVALGLDIQFPGLTAGYLYIPLLILCRSSRQALLCSAGWSTFLLLVGFLSAGPEFGGTALVNRMIAVALLWLLAGVLPVQQARTEVSGGADLPAAVLIARLAHETRNAFQVSQSCVDILAIKLGDRPDLQPLLADIQKAQNHVHRFYEDLRKYVSPRPLKFEVTDLKDTVDDVWARLTGGNSELRLEHSMAGTPELRVKIDREAFVDAVHNVLRNAVDACGTSAHVLVHWSETELSGRHAICVSIRDNGAGLTPEARQRLFEPFFTTKRHRSGLGMAIARRQVEALGGKIEAASSSGPGTEIAITLPRHSG